MPTLHTGLEEATADIALERKRCLDEVPTDQGFCFILTRCQTIMIWLTIIIILFGHIFLSDCQIDHYS